MMTPESNRPGSGTTRRRFLGSALTAAAGIALLPRALAELQVLPVTLGGAAEHPIPENYAGFSYEKAQMADPAFFCEQNRGLIAIFRALGTQGVLRIGGNSSDYCWWKTDAPHLTFAGISGSRLLRAGDKLKQSLPAMKRHTCDGEELVHFALRAGFTAAGGAVVLLTTRLG